MSEVDPFIIDIPDEFMRNPQTAEYFRYLHKFLHDLWVRSGAYQDGIEQIADVLTAVPGAELPENSEGEAITGDQVENLDDFWRFVGVTS